MKRTVPRKHPACPSCGSTDVAEVLYGFVIPDEMLSAAAGRGEVVFGGCVVTGDDPRWECNVCEARFGSTRPDTDGPANRRS